MKHTPTLIVFLGPTLSIQEAKAILPKAYYLPPVRCGDVLHVMRLQPDAILIIDGYFDRTAAVWHKEILYALSKKVCVFGASSMGALRAAELHIFGMQGIGRIFMDYKSNRLLDDDEVAILHQSAHYNYRALTDAMVNIRATLEQAVKQVILDQKTATYILKSAKALFYKKRTLNNACVDAINQGGNELDIQHFLEWSVRDGYVDLKKQDAIALLNKVNTTANLRKNSSRTIDNKDLSKTTFLRTLHRRTTCKPFSTYQPWLPISEKTLCISRLLADDYLLIKRLAYLMAIVYTLSIKQYKIVDSDKVFICDITSIEKLRSAENDMSDNGIEAFLDRQKAISQFYFDSHHIINDSYIQRYFMYLMKLSGDYVRYKKSNGLLNKKHEEIIQLFKKNDSQKYYIVFYTAYLWAVVDGKADEYALEPNENEMLRAMRDFTSKYNIKNQTDFSAWLSDNDLNSMQFSALLVSMTRFDYLVTRNNTDAIGAYQKDETTCWLLEAFYLTNYYQRAKRLLKDVDYADKAISHLTNKIEKTGNQYAYALDFDLGADEFIEFIQSFKQDLG